MNHLGKYRDRKLVSADREDLDLSKTTGTPQAESPEMPKEDLFSQDALNVFCAWMKEVLGDRVEAVKPSARLVDSPAMIVNVGGFSVDRKSVV